MTVSAMYRPALILIWLVAVVPVNLLCLAAFMMGIGLGSDVPHRSNWPQYLLVLALPLLGASLSTGLAWLSVHLWRNSRWRRASFPMAIFYYAAVAFIIWAVVVKHWIY